MHKVQIHADAISRLLCGFASVWAIIHSLKLVDYLPLHRQKAYNNFCVLDSISLRLVVICSLKRKTDRNYNELLGAVNTQV